MFIGVTGEPGSGKSAFAVDYVLKHKNEYKSVYVNINGFKMHDNIKPLNFPKLEEIISNCKDIYDKQIATLGNSGNDNIIDKPIVDYLKSIEFLSDNPKYKEYLEQIEQRKKVPSLKRFFLNIFKPIKKESEYLPTLFVIDEVQNHMGAIDPVTGKELKTANPILTWWVSYHRHLYMDVLILSQQYQKIHIAYRRDISYFIDGIESQSLLLGKFSPDFVYKKHKESPYSKKNETAKVKVKKRKELFDAYESGDAVRSKSVILPWIIFALVLLVLVIAIFSYVISTFYGDESKDNNQTRPTPSRYTRIAESHIIEASVMGKKYILFNCINTSCSNKELKIQLNIDDLAFLVESTDSRFLATTKYSSFFGTVSLLASQDFLNLFQGANNGKSNQGFNLIN